LNTIEGKSSHHGARRKKRKTRTFMVVTLGRSRRKRYRIPMAGDFRESRTGQRFHVILPRKTIKKVKTV